MQDYKDKRQNIYSSLIMSKPYNTMPKFKYLRDLYNEIFSVK